MVKEQILLITDDDLDGIVGGFLVSEEFKKRGDDVEWKYGRKDFLNDLIIEDSLFDYDRIIMVDCSPKRRSDIAFCEDIGIPLEVNDHHRTAEENINAWGFGDNKNYNIVTSMCGAKIAYMKYNTSKSKTLSKIVETTNLWDMWKEESNNFKQAKELNRKLYFLGVEKFIQSLKFAVENELGLDILNKDDRAAFASYIEKEDEYVKEKVKRAIVIENYAIAFCEKNQSEIGNSLLDRKDGVRVAIMVNVDKNSVSVRSNTGEALATVKKITYNGGGHSNASGGTIDVKADIIDWITKQIL